MFDKLISWLREFLSTLPARGATTGMKQTSKQEWNFYPRSPRGERPQRA